MIAGDGIGFHAIAEMITSIPAPIIYLSVSKNTNQLSSSFFKKRDNYSIPVEDPILWDDDTNILWDNNTEISWDE